MLRVIIRYGPTRETPTPGRRTQHQELDMLSLYLWSLAFALAVVLAGLMLRIVRLPERQPRPVPIEIRRSPEGRRPPR